MIEKDFSQYFFTKSQGWFLWVNTIVVLVVMVLLDLKVFMFSVSSLIGLDYLDLQGLFLRLLMIDRARGFMTVID